MCIYTCMYFFVWWIVAQLAKRFGQTGIGTRGSPLPVPLTHESHNGTWPFIGPCILGIPASIRRGP